MTKTIQVHLHDGNKITAEVTGYNSEELAIKMNDPKVLMIPIGNAVVNKNIVKYIIETPITVEPVTE